LSRFGNLLIFSCDTSRTGTVAYRPELAASSKLAQQIHR